VPTVGAPTHALRDRDPLARSAILASPVRAANPTLRGLHLNPAAQDLAPTAADPSRAALGLAPIVADPIHAVRDLAPTVADPIRAVWDLAPTVADPIRAVRDLAPIVADLIHALRDLTEGRVARAPVVIRLSAALMAVRLIFLT